MKQLHVNVSIYNNLRKNCVLKLLNSNSNVLNTSVENHHLFSNTSSLFLLECYLKLLSHTFKIYIYIFKGQLKGKKSFIT